jgi:hypothetical protein
MPECITHKTLTSVTKAVMNRKHISRVPCSHTQKEIHISHNTPKVSVHFIKQNSKAEEWVMATEGALPLHALKYYTGNNYSLQ